MSDGAGNPARWTILLGDNGVGKTTLLQCLALMAPKVMIKNHGTGEEFRQTMPAMVPDIFLKAPEGSKLHRRDRRFTLKATIALADDFSAKDTGEVIVNRYEAGGFSSSCRQDLCPFILFGYGAMRRIGNTSLAERPGGDTTATLFDDNIPLVNAEEWLLKADYAATKSQEAAAVRRYEKIKQVLISLLPDVEDIRIEARGALPPEVEVKMPYGWVLMRGLSSGYRSVVAWMVDLASRMFDLYPESADPLGEPAVLLVDQIDVFLHPKWQRDLVASLSSIFKRTQFIVTAHSPLIVQSAPGANLAVLRRDGDHVVIDQSQESVKGWRLDQILASDLFDRTETRDRQTETLLNERKGLLSKGSITSEEKGRLTEIEAQLGTIPVGETPEEIRAMKVIQDAARALRK